MAKMTCKCGALLSNSESPNDIQLRVYSDKEWDKILSDDIIEFSKFPLPKYDVWKCPECKRIYVFEDGLNVYKRVYKVEEEN